MRQLQKTRIVYANHTGKVSGAERVLLNMLEGLEPAQFEPYVLCPADGDLSRMVMQEGIRWLPAPPIEARFTWRPDRLVRYALSLCRAMFTMRKTIVETNPDIVHANTLRAGIAATLATIGTGRTVIWHVHDILPQHPISTAIRLLAYLSRRTRVIAVSHATAASFCGTLAFNSRVRTIYNGTDLERFPRKRPGSSSFRQEAGIPQGAFLICAVGQICARKGLRELLDAFSKIHARAPSMHLAIVGKVIFPHEEQYRESLVAAAVAAGIADRVHFTGERRDVSAVLQAADLLVLNSLEEPFGLVLIEAMSCGTPVLASHVGGIPEIVCDAENGWLVAKGDTEGLAIKLLGLSQDPEKLARVARVAHDTTTPQFSLQRFQRNVQKTYSELHASAEAQWNGHNCTAFVRDGDNKGDRYA